MVQAEFSPDFTQRVRDAYVGSWISLAQISENSEEMFGQFVPLDTIKKWSASHNWEDRRRQARVLCPHCNGDITSVISGGEIDVGYMYKYLLVRAFDEMVISKALDPNKVREWKNLVKEAGIKPSVGKQSAMSDIDIVLAEMETHGS